MRKFSIILPMRNGGEYGKECITSILNQSSNNFNLIILDNCSTDGIPEWAEKKGDDRILIFRADKPLTIEENWARVVNVPKNEFMTMIGHDDILASNYLEIMEKLISKYPDASLYQAHFKFIDSKGSVIRSCKPMAELEDGPAFLKSVLQNNFDLFGTGFMMRSKDYEMLGGIPAYPNLLFADFELWMELTRKRYKATSPEFCFYYRLHFSTTKSSGDETMNKAFSRFITYLHSLSQQDGKYREVIQQNALQFLRHHCQGLVHRLIRSPFDQRKGMTVSGVSNQCKQYADLLIRENAFDPMNDWSIRLARFIDSNSVTRKLFHLFRKVHSKPVMK